MPVTDSKPTSDNPQTQAPQNVQYAVPYPQQFEDDTIDLYELWITLWNKKWLIIAAAFKNKKQGLFCCCFKAKIRRSTAA